MEADNRPDGAPPGPKIVDPTGEHARSILESAEVVAGAQVRLGSNYTFLVHLDAGSDGSVMRAIYKPRAGERPLYDYPDGTLYLREYSAFLVAERLGWPRIPETVVRDGPHGTGSMQRFVEFDPSVNYFDLREDRMGDLAPFAVFDLLVNNGDRKGGHFLRDAHGDIWSIDHGLTFSQYFNVRTVMLEFWGEPIPGQLLADLAAAASELDSGGNLGALLGEHLSAEEMDALRARLDAICEAKVHPMLDPRRHVPWPLV